MQFGRSRPFPFLIALSTRSLSQFVASPRQLKHLLYEQLFACHWISPSAPDPATVPLSLHYPDIRYNKRSTPNPPTQHSPEQPEASQSPGQS